jgi:hypothetical protein
MSQGNVPLRHIGEGDWYETLMTKRNVSHRQPRSLSPKGSGGFIVVHRHRSGGLEVVNLAHVRRIMTEPWDGRETTRLIFNRPEQEEGEVPFYVRESIEEVLDLIEAAR